MENKIDIKDCCAPEHRAGKVLRVIGMVFLGVIFAVLFALVFGFLVKWLWNYLMPGLFGLAQITYFQAFAMVVLAKLLFGGFGCHSPKHPPMHHHPFEKWHGRFNCHGSEPWDAKGSHFKNFSRYWQEEGKEAFDAYIKKSQEKENEAKK